MGLFIFIIMIDPTNTIIHKKDVVFILVVAFNIAVFKPDFSKLPHILLMVCAVTMPWLIATIRSVPYNSEEALAIFKAISPIILLLWVREYDMVQLSKAPVVICCGICAIIYIAMLSNPLIESGVWVYMDSKDNPVMMARRNVLGVEIFAFYLKSTISFVFGLSAFLLAVIKHQRPFVPQLLALAIILFYFFVSGTRSTMLVPFFLFIVIGYQHFKESKYMKYIMTPAIALMTIAFIVVIFAAATEEKEYSNVIKFGHLTSYAELFAENPSYLILGQGPGTSFFSEGFGKIVYKTEWAYLELIRNFGIFSLIIIGIFWKPLFTFFKYKHDDDLTRAVFWAYLAYLLIAGTNPLILSSTGMISLLIAYSYESQILRNKYDKCIDGDI